MTPQRSSEPGLPPDATRIFRMAASGAADVDRLTVDAPPEELIGFLDTLGSIYRLRWGEATPVGRFGVDGSIFRTTAHSEREVGQVLETGAIRSAGLFEGGEQGWMEPDGVVIQAGMILGEQEVGRVEGPNALAAAAALLLLFLPDAAESDRRAARGG